MDNRTCIDSTTYLTILNDQFQHQLDRGLHRVDAWTRAKQNVAAAFTTQDFLDDIDYQKDKDDERSADWTR